MWMYSGRSLRSGSVVYSSRAKSANAGSGDLHQLHALAAGAQIGHLHATVA